MKYFISGWKNIANTKGRTPRKEFWVFIIISSVIVNGLGIGGTLLMGTSYEPIGRLMLTVSITYGLVAFLPTIAILIRRLHDINWPTWLVFLLLIPFFGRVFLVISGLIPSKPGKNKFGSNPHDEVVEVPKHKEY